MAGFKVPRYVEFLDELPTERDGQGGEGPVDNRCAKRLHSA